MLLSSPEWGFRGLGLRFRGRLSEGFGFLAAFLFESIARGVVPWESRFQWMFKEQELLYNSDPKVLRFSFSGFAVIL